MNRHAPSLEDRIRTALANPLGSDALSELIREVETAEAAATAVATSARADMTDLVRCPEPDAARDRLVKSETKRDRLAAARKPLGDALTAALTAEAKDRWWSRYKRVKTRLEAAVTAYRDYQQHAEAIISLFAIAAEVDREVSDLNGSAPNGIDRRLRSVELTARGMMAFTRDNPSLATTVVLPDWNHSGRTIWPAKPSTSLAVAYAESMIVPRHPGPAWSTPEVQQQRRAEVLKGQRELGEHYATMTAEQEATQNAAEREKLSAHRR